MYLSILSHDDSILTNYFKLLVRSLLCTTGVLLWGYISDTYWVSIKYFQPQE